MVFLFKSYIVIFEMMSSLQLIRSKLNTGLELCTGE